MPKRFPIAQFPNAPLLAAWAAGAVALLGSGRTRRDAAVLSRVAMLVWSSLELVHGANWLRRLLGAAAGARSAAALARIVRG
jgi:hypothetical protein